MPSILGVASGTYPTIGALLFPIVGIVFDTPTRVSTALLAAGVTDAGVPVVTLGATGGRNPSQGLVAKGNVGRDPRIGRGGDVVALVT